MNHIPAIFARILLVIFITGSTVGSSFASSRTDKITLKARQAVAEASPDDWHTLAESAEQCMAEGVNLKEAAVWLDQSITIRETAYNLKLKGDYYASNRLPKQALEHYSKSIRVGMLADPSYTDADTQGKIVALVEHQQ